MKREDIKNSFDKIGPDDNTIQRMYNRIVSNPHNSKRSGFIIMRKVVPVALGVMVLAVSLFTYSALTGNKPATTGNKPTTEAPKDAAYNGRAVTDDLATGEGTAELAPAPVDTFEIDGRHYFILSENDREAFGFADTIRDEDIGDSIAKIKSTGDESIKGKDVYEYLPAGCHAVVAVKKQTGYKLYKFSSFESYNNNKDEDVNTYLKLFGINSAKDIAKIEFFGRDSSPQVKSEITDTANKQKFYDFYSVLKDASDKYFEKLYSIRKEPYENQYPDVEPDQLPPDYRSPADAPDSNQASGQLTPKQEIAIAQDSIAPADGQLRSGVGYDDGSAGSIDGKQGAVGNVLGNSVVIRIYNKNGVYMETVYYKNFGFISRHEVSKEFAYFLKDFC